jgi:hypothetical protein
MGFTVENKENNEKYGLVKFVFNEPFTSDDMIKVLAILSSLLDSKKPFAFYVDTRTANSPPLNAASMLLKWLKANKFRFKKQLICSSVIFGNTVTNNLVSKLLNGVFMIQPPVSPNKLTNNLEQAEKWISEKIKEYLITIQ